ncbi:MAG: hypothetical protein GY882_12895 [Actinomycetia bacterium]|nr:hypothetical protein [Actinomycetes bacterium]MCP4843476.1 hypothetical protein [Actinomycetes bacterium]
MTLHTPERIAANAATAGRRIAFYLGTVALCAAFAYCWLNWGPARDRGLDLLFLVPVGIATTSCAYGLARLSWGMKVKSVWATAATAATLMVLLCWGATTTVFIDGQPHLATSVEARGYTMAADLWDDIQVISRHDELLLVDDTTGRARLREYDPAAMELNEIRSRWARTDLADLPSPDFIDLISATATAADWASRAIVLRSQLLISDDARTQADLGIARQTMVDNTLAAGRLVAEIGPQFGFDLRQGMPSE